MWFWSVLGWPFGISLGLFCNSGLNFKSTTVLKHTEAVKEATLTQSSAPISSRYLRTA